MSLFGWLVWTYGATLGIIWVVRNASVIIVAQLLRLLAPSLGPSKEYITISELFAMSMVVCISAVHSHFVVPSQVSGISPVLADLVGIAAYVTIVPSAYFISLYEMAYCLYPPEMMNEGFMVARRTRISLLLIAPIGLLLNIGLVFSFGLEGTASMFSKSLVTTFVHTVMNSWVRWLFPLVGVYYLISIVRQFLDTHARRSSWELLLTLK